jgi:hypothetical protein
VTAFAEILAVNSAGVSAAAAAAMVSSLKMARPAPAALAPSAAR